MNRPAVRLLLLLSAALLAGFLLPSARADGPALTAKFGVAGRYKPIGGWCLVTVGVTNPGPETLSGQVQVLAVDSGGGQSGFGRRGFRADTPSATFACPVSVPGGSTAPRTFPLYVRGIDPGQADLSVRLVEGQGRGDGRVLTQISSQNPSQSAAFSGSPISGADRLVIGFGGDPGAFLFLNGRPLPGTNPLNPGTPATVQVAEAAAADLPDRAAGYAHVHAFLLRSDAPLEALTEAQTDALKNWVASGGHLIVCGGTDPSRFGAAFFNGLLPAAVGPSLLSGSLTLTPKPLPGVHVVQSSGKALMVAGPYGAGTVTMTAFDPTAPAFRSATAAALPPVWQTLFSSRPPASASVLARAAFHEENTGQYYYGSSPRLSETVIRGPSLDAPGTLVIALFLLAYLVILVPVNYLVLKRLDRKEWAWGTIPALVLLFAAGTFGVGYAAKGGSVFVNRAALVETRAGQQKAGVYFEVGLFSPHRSSYDIDLPGSGLVAAVPNPNLDYGGQNDAPTSGAAQLVETPSGVSLPNTPVNMWAMRAFDVQSTVDLGGAIDGRLSVKTGPLTGSLVNHTAYALTDCAVLYGGHWLSIGPLASGAALTVSGNGPVSGDLPLPPHNTEDPHSDIHERMQDALGSYFRSLGQGETSVNSGNNAQTGFVPSTGEALLVGWSRDPALAGPPPKIDGNTVAENDESLVIVHVPVK